METRRNRDLARELERMGGRGGQPLWVGEGQEPFLAVLTPQEGLKIKGGVILLHDQAQHPDWPGVLRALRTQLPASGWMTLSVAVPDYVPPPDQQAPPGGSAPDPGESRSAGTEPDPRGRRIVVPGGNNGAFLQRQAEFAPEDYRQEVRTRIDQAIERLKTEDDMPITLAAIGQTAGLVSGLLAMEPDERLDALVLVEPEEFPEEGFRLAEDVGALDMPVLDIVNDELDDGAARWRKQEAGRNADSHYDQRRIMSADRDFEGFESSVAKSVSGWMLRRVVPPPVADVGKGAAVTAGGTAAPPMGAAPSATALQTAPDGSPVTTPAVAGTPAVTPGAAPAREETAATAGAAPPPTASAAPPPPVPGRPRLITPNLQEAVPIPPPVPPPTP
jgi:hypothetical protein